MSGCVVGVAGILQAWYDMWFIPAGSQSHNKNDTCVYTAVLLTFAESHNKHTHSGAIMGLKSVFPVNYFHSTLSYHTLIFVIFRGGQWS